MDHGRFGISRRSPHRSVRLCHPRTPPRNRPPLARRDGFELCLAFVECSSGTRQWSMVRSTYCQYNSPTLLPRPRYQSQPHVDDGGERLSVGVHQSRPVGDDPCLPTSSQQQQGHSSPAPSHLRLHQAPSTPSSQRRRSNDPQESHRWSGSCFKDKRSAHSGRRRAAYQARTRWFLVGGDSRRLCRRAARSQPRRHGELV